MKSYYDLHPTNLPPEKESTIKLEEIRIANMNEIVFASDNHPIIGTYALATCVGIIMTDNKGNYCLGHILNDYDILINDMLKPMQNKENISVTIIPGTYTTPEKLEEIITFLNNREMFLPYNFAITIKKLKHFENQKFHSIEFAYDTTKNEFIKPNYDDLIFSNRRRKNG